MFIPLISIIIPNYNRGYLIGETLNSIISQTYKNWEAIVVDDNSIDNSEEIINLYISYDNRIRLIKRNRSPKGAPTCRNIGIDNAKGEFVIFLDSDDLLAPYCLEDRVVCLKENKEFDFLIFPMLSFKKMPGDSTQLWNKMNVEDDLGSFLMGNPLWAISSPIWKIKIIKELGGFDENALLWQDWEFHIRAIALEKKYKKIYSTPDCFVRRDDTNNRISNTEYHFKQIVSKKYLFDNIYKFLIKNSKLNSDQKKKFASLLFKHSENLALVIQNDFNNREYSLISILFSKLIIKHKLIFAHIAIIQFVYIKTLLLLKDLRPYFIVKVIRGIIYRFFHLFMPSYLISHNVNLFRFVISQSELEDVKRRNDKQLFTFKLRKNKL